MEEAFQINIYTVTNLLYIIILCFKKKIKKIKNKTKNT